MRDLEIETARFEIGGDPEVVKVTEAAGNTLSHLEQAVDGFDGGVGEACFEVGQNAVKVIFQGSGEFAEGFEPRAVGPAQPPADGGQISIGEDLLERLAQGDGASELGISAGQRATQVELLLRARPLVASDGPEPASQIGTLLAQVFAH